MPAEDPLNPGVLVTGRVRSLVDPATGKVADPAVYEHNAPVVRAFLYNSPLYGKHPDKDRAMRYQRLARSCSVSKLKKDFFYLAVRVAAEGEEAEPVAAGRSLPTHRHQATFNFPGIGQKQYECFIAGGDVFQLGVQWQRENATGTGQGDKVCMGTGGRGRRWLRFVHGFGDGVSRRPASHTTTHTRTQRISPPSVHRLGKRSCPRRTGTTAPRPRWGAPSSTSSIGSSPSFAQCTFKGGVAVPAAGWWVARLCPALSHQTRPHSPHIITARRRWRRRTRWASGTRSPRSARSAAIPWAPSSSCAG